MATSPTVGRAGSENPATCTVHLPYNSVAVTDQPGAAMNAIPRWKEWQGQSAGKFPLKEYLGGNAQSGVFITEFNGTEAQKAAIRLVVAEAGNADARLSRWARAEKLSHPNLLRVHASGRCELSGTQFLYVVMEYAEENLAQILPQRALTSAEASEMLPPVLDALAYLHSNRYVHGDIRPSNIMAVGDRVKLPCDGLVSIASGLTDEPHAATAYDAAEWKSSTISPAMDVCALGVMLAEVLTQRLPERDAMGEVRLPQSLPQPFLDIARNCVQQDPQKRWTIAQIRARLQGKSVAAAPQVAVPKPIVVENTTPSVDIPVATTPLAKRIVRWPYFSAMAIGFVVLALIVGSIVWDSQSASKQPHGPSVQPTPKFAASRPESAKPSPATGASSPAAVTSRRPATPVASRVNAHGAVLHPVYPDVPRSARDTIEGHVRVAVRLNVNDAGNVTGASLQSAGPSKYFDRLALESAREWKFTPPEVKGRAVASEWILRYAFGRKDTRIHPQQRRP